MNKDIEVWKDIPEYQGYYQISDRGRVKSLMRTVTVKSSTKYPNGRSVVYKEKILNPMCDANGYLFVQLYKNDKFKSKRIHRIVAQVFLQNPNGFSQVNHKDENKENNRVDNLEWCDAKYNVNYGTGKYRKVRNNIPVKQYDLSGNFIKQYNSATEATKDLKIPQYRAKDILKVCRGVGKTVNGYIWKFTNN